mmetsp:Transcript_21981/g.52120  ORF Transcript_21981/g.52120 Transcript_21981/m.52120 type:complete len:243 (-) Transcript_21981:98-826(-)
MRSTIRNGALQILTLQDHHCLSRHMLRMLATWLMARRWKQPATTPREWQHQSRPRHQLQWQQQRLLRCQLQFPWRHQYPLRWQLPLQFRCRLPPPPPFHPHSPCRRHLCHQPRSHRCPHLQLPPLLRLPSACPQLRQLRPMSRIQFRQLLRLQLQLRLHPPQPQPRQPRPRQFEGAWQRVMTWTAWPMERRSAEQETTSIASLSRRAMPAPPDSLEGVLLTRRSRSPRAISPIDDSHGPGPS